MYNATITTCSGENPTVYAKAKEVRVLDEKKASGVFIKAKHVTFFVGPVPVFYTPIWQRHLGYRIFTFTVGYGSRVGAFLMGRAELHPTEWLTSNTHFDLYSKRGLGIGQDFDWVTPHGKGAIETYYIDDNDPYSNKDDSAVEKALTDSQRYRIKITHREQLNKETYFSTKLNWLSDPGVLRDFFNEEYKYAANPENYAVVQHSAEDYAASLRLDRRMYDFYTAVDRMPELTYDKYRSQIGDSPFVFESENSAVYLDKRHSETNAPLIPDYNSARFDTHDQIFLPLRFDEFFNVIPRAGYRGTWYSDTETGDAALRNLYELGTLTSFKSYKTLTEKSSYFGTGLRHVVEPYADYSYRYATMHTNEIHQFDAIDALDEQNEVRLGARNLLQSKRGVKRIANVVDSDVYTTYRLDHRSGERAFSNLVADTEVSLTDNFFIGTDLEYNWYTHDLTPANARAKFITDDQSEYSLEYRYLDGTRSLFTPKAVLFPNDKWSYEFSASYDGKYDEWYERKILINHKFDCIGMGVGLKVDEDNEPQFWIQFWLTAFPKSEVKL
ncbi:MAG: LPS-assembly protein LptD [Verrucomicrobia bacterium]|nr:LPS-assembly protein LptD [Verrucomicrobiota bacterium]